MCGSLITAVVKHVHCLLHPSFKCADNCWQAQVMKILIVNFPPLLFLHLFFQMFFLAVCSETFSVCALHLGWETRFHSYCKQQENYVLYASVIIIWCQRRRDKWFWVTAGISQNLCALSFLLMPHIDLLTVIILWICQVFCWWDMVIYIFFPIFRVISILDLLIQISTLFCMLFMVSCNNLTS
jgi:hypothetical protein